MLSIVEASPLTKVIQMRRMEDAFIHEGIGGGFNDEALRAVKLLGKTGFEPGRLKGKANLRREGER